MRYASQLPLLRQKFNPDTKNVEIDAESIEEIQQRPLDWSRQASLAQYLAARKNHKFPPVLVVINQPWVDNPKANQWDANQRALQPATEFTPLDKDGNVGLLDVSADVTIFAFRRSTPTYGRTRINGVNSNR